MDSLLKDLLQYQNQEKISIYLRFFKTGKGEYAEGDKFLGLTTPQLHTVVKKYREMDLQNVKLLISSPFHEARMACLQLLVWNFRHGNAAIKKDIYDFYLKNTRFINNWDLVDVTAPHIVGTYLLDKPKNILINLAQSDLL